MNQPALTNAAACKNRDKDPKLLPASRWRSAGVGLPGGPAHPGCDPPRVRHSCDRPTPSSCHGRSGSEAWSMAGRDPSGRSRSWSPPGRAAVAPGAVSCGREDAVITEARVRLWNRGARSRPSGDSGRVARLRNALPSSHNAAAATGIGGIRCCGGHRDPDLSRAGLGLASRKAPAAT